MSSARHWLLTGTALSISGSAVASETISYTYDARGRLTAATRSGTVNNGVAANYTYDKADNRANVTVTGAATNGAAGGTTIMSQPSGPMALSESGDSGQSAAPAEPSPMVEPDSSISSTPSGDGPT